MAKSKPSKKKEKKGQQNGTQELSVEMAGPLFEQATELLQEGQPNEALPVAQKLIKCLSGPGVDTALKLPALDLLGEIYIELGEAEEARNVFLEAVKLDPDGSLGNEVSGGADKFLWLAQLCDQGGQESVDWFEKGAVVLRRELGQYEGRALSEEDEVIQEIKRNKLSNALCGAAEVYMTDLSWNEDAEQRCEALVTEACMVAPESCEPLQTLASVRLSQSKLEDAQAALARSLELWIDLPPEDLSAIPDFPTRISLSRLLMEADMEEQALEVLERLIAEDDHSVEAWYLGGWCLHLLAGKQDENNAAVKEEEKGKDQKTTTLKSSRDWLLRCLKLYNKLEYEDDRLKTHAEELLEEMNQVLGPAPADGEADDDDEEWEGIEEDEEDGDAEMAGT